MWLVGVVIRRYIDFLILLIPTPLVSALFLQQHPYFFLLIKKKFFRSCSSTFFGNLCKHFPRSINTNTGDYGRPTEAL